jgi:hypothetical protein
MRLGQRRIVDGEYLVRHLAKDDVFVRFVHGGKAGAREFAVLMLDGRRARLLIGGKMTELRMEDECIIASIGRGVSSDRTLRQGSALAYRSPR